MFSIIGKLLDLLSFREKIFLYLLLVALIGLAAIELLGIASIMPFMAVVASPDIVHTNRWLKIAYDFCGFDNLRSFLFFLGMIVLCLLIFSNLFKALTTYWTLKYDNWLNYMLARRLLASYLARPYEFFLSRNTVEMGKNVLAEVRTVIALILSPIMQALSGILVSFFILVLLLIVNPTIAVTVILVLGGAYSIIYLIAARRLATIGQVQFKANTMKYKIANETLAGIKDLKILGREWVFLEEFAIHAQCHARSNTESGIVSKIPRYALETIAFGGILIIILFELGSEQTFVQLIPLLALYAFAGYRLLPALQQVFSNLSSVRFNLPALEILHRDLREGKVIVDPNSHLKRTQNLQPLSFTNEFVFSDVAYRYPGTREYAIKGINLTIAPKTSIGFVGTTGSGKTTTVDLILGLLTPSSGKLLVDGVEIDGDNLARWQRNLGYIPQHIYLSDDSIARNIAFGVPADEIDMDAVRHAARIANLAEFVEKELPQGYEAKIGERGVRLSGGQRQRIGIARALYRDPTVLIMDEATSALDSVTEEAVMEALHTLAGEKTIIMIAHRLTTVKDCNIIYVLDQGRLVDQGAFFDLEKSSEWFQAAAKIRT